MSKSKLEKRISALLDPRKSREKTIGRAGMATSAVLVCGIGVVGALAFSTRAQAQQLTGHVEGTPKGSSKCWKLSYKQDDHTVYYFVYQVSDRLFGYTVSRTSQGGMAAGSVTGSTADLDGWHHFPPPISIEGKPLVPFRIILPEYRSYLAEHGFQVEASSLNEVRAHFPMMDIPPDAEEQRESYVSQMGQRGSTGLIGPAVYSEGKLLGVIGEGVLREVSEKNLHWPGSANSSDQPTTGYWELDFPSPNSPTSYVVHRSASGIDVTHINAQPSYAEVRNGNAPEIDSWSLRKHAQQLPLSGAPMSVNSVVVNPAHLEDPQYRARITANGVTVRAITKDRAADLTNLRFDRQLEIALASAAHDDAENTRRQQEENLAKLKANPPLMPIGYGPSGEIVINGKKSLVYGANAVRREAPKFDEVAAREALVAQDRILDDLAHQWADAEVRLSEAKQKSPDGTGASLYAAEEANSSISQKTMGQLFRYGGDNPMDLPVGSEPFFRKILESLTKERDSLSRKSDQADAAFKTGTITEHEMQLADKLWIVADHKVRSLERRLRMPKHNFGGNLAPNPLIEFDSEPITFDAENQDVTDVIKTIFRGSKIAYQISHDVEGKLSVSAKTAPRSMVLRQVLDAVSAQSKVEDGKYLIEKKSS